MMCEIVDVLLHFMLFCSKSHFYAIYAVLSRFTLFCRELCFVAIYALLCGEKLNQKLPLWRKMTNIRYEWIAEAAMMGETMISNCSNQPRPKSVVLTIWKFLQCFVGNSLLFAKTNCSH